MTKPETAQIVSAAELADSLCANLSLDQLELLRIFARCSLGGVSHVHFCKIADGFAQELPRRRRKVVEEIVNGVGQGMPFVETLKGAKNGNYRLIEEALNAAAQYDCLKPLLTAVLNYEPTKRSLGLIHQDSLKKKLFRLGIKTFVILSVVTFIMLYIVPEFSKMSAEFGTDWPPLLQILISTSVLLVHFWFIPALLILIAIIYFFMTTSELGTRLTRRFSPWRWLDRPLSPDQRQKLIFAWMGGNHVASDTAKATAIKGAEAKALETATSPETRSWIIRHAMKQNDERKRHWRNRFGNGFVLSWNLILAVVVAVAAASVILSLISFMELIHG